MTDGIDSLYIRIKERLIEFDFEPSATRTENIFYAIMWEHSYFLNGLSEKDIDSTIKNVYNFDRVKNTRLAHKMTNKEDIIKTTDDWIYLRDYGEKK